MWNKRATWESQTDDTKYATQQSTVEKIKSKENKYNKFDYNIFAASYHPTNPKIALLSC